MSNEMNIQPMALENPVCSTDCIWRCEDMDRSLTSDLVAIETAIAGLCSDCRCAGAESRS